MSILVEGFKENEVVELGQTFTSKTPLTVNKEGHKRQLAPDVMALLYKAYIRYRMAVRMADGFVEFTQVPPITVTSVRDSRGEPWSASITFGHNYYRYTNWCGEEFPIVFE